LENYDIALIIEIFNDSVHE